MANLNLSEFGEKLFVTDADHTFIWDTAASISKKVSRNSWLNSGTLTSDAPVTISQTWGNNLATFKALVVNAAGTSDANSASGSLLADFQVNAVSKASVNKNGLVSVPDSAGNGGFVFRPGNTGSGGIGYLSGGGFGVWAGAGAAIGFSTGAALVGNIQTALYTDGAGQLALRNGINPQTFNVYGTWTTAITNFERLAIKYNTTDLAYQIAAEKGSTNGDYRPLQLWTGGASRLHVTTAGNVGIGTTTPRYRLSNTNIVLSDYSSIEPSITSGFGWLASEANKYASSFSNNAVGGYGMNIYANSNGTQRLLTLLNSSGDVVNFLANGNLGIGTTSPTSKLHVAGEAFLAVNGSNTAPSLRIGAGANINGWYSYGGLQLNAVVNSLNMFGINSAGTNISAGNLSFGSGDVVLERDGEADHLAMRRGALGQKFSVYGTYPGAAWERFTITAPTSGNVLLGTYKGTGGIARGLEFQTDGVTRMSIGPTGNIGIGTPAGSSKLEVSGSVDVTLLRTGFYVQAATQFMFGSGGAGDIALQRNAAGVVEINNTTAGTYRDLRCRSVIEQPPASITPALNGDLVVEATSNTTLTFKLKGTDGTVRSGTITLSV